MRTPLISFRSRKLFFLFLSILICILFASSQPLFAAESQPEQVKATYYVLRDGLVQPTGQDYLNWNGYLRVGYGTITSPTEILNDSVNVTSLLGDIPTNPTRICEDQQVVWYTVRQTSDEWRVEGKILTENETDGAENAVFYLLHKGVTCPDPIPSVFHTAFFTQLGYGTVLPSSDTTIDGATASVVSAPSCDSYLSEGDYVVWSTVRKQNGVWEVVGEIRNDITSISQQDTVTFYLLKPDIEKPTSGTSLLWSDYTRIGYGTIQHTEDPDNLSSDIASLLLDVPDCGNYLTEGHSVEWYVVRECSDFTDWRVDGIIVPNTSVSADFLRVDGTQIVDSSGTPFQLKGIGMGNNVWYTQWQLPTTDHDEASFAELEQLGFNSVRFYLNASLFESDETPYTYSEDAFRWLDDNVQWAKKHNIRLLLNMHIPQGGKTTASNTAFWDDAEYQKRFLALWTELARRYADEDTILGYGLLNEPFVPECNTADEALDLYYALMEQTATAIRSVDTNHILFVERPYGTVNSVKHTTNYVWGTTDSFRLISDTNTAYEFHFYDRTEFTHQGLDWLSYTDRWVYNNDAMALLSGTRQLGKIFKAEPTATDLTSVTWQHIETAPIAITNPNANYGYWIIYLNNIGQNASAYLDNIVIKEYDENGMYLRDLHTFTFDSVTECAGWDLGSGGGGTVLYSTTGGVNKSGCAQISNVTASYRFYRQYTADMNFPVNPNHTYVVCADLLLDNVSEGFTLELGIQTGSCDNVYSFDKEYLRACLQPFLTFGAQNNVPLYLGEFGVTRHIMNDEYHGDAWVEDIFDLINEYNLSYSYHDYHEENFGLYISDSRTPRDEINQTLYQIFTQKLQ